MRLIDADLLRKNMEFICMGIMAGTEPYNSPLTEIDNAPAVTNRPQGEWIDEGLYADYHSEHAYRCKKCGWHIIESPDLIFENRFCKHCGAEMKGGAE